MKISSRQEVIVPGNKEETILFCVNQLIDLATHYIEKQGYFSLALSGGSTPKAVYQLLASSENKDKIDWQKVLLFWSDERSVPPQDKDSNFHMAMEAGLKHLPLKKENIFRMQAEDNIEENAKLYQELIINKIPNQKLDVCLLGMGDDGHTASLFPHTEALKEEHKLVVANYVPQKETWRMSLTYKAINASSHILIYLIGKDKAGMAYQVLKGPFKPLDYPIQKVGTDTNLATWILDKEASANL